MTAAVTGSTVAQLDTRATSEDDDASYPTSTSANRPMAVTAGPSGR